jgi:D-alanine--poly(phosphoribitol) ligase subunit 1
MKFCFDTKEFIELNENADKLAVIGSDKSYSWNTFKLRVEEIVAFLQSNNLDQISHPVIVSGHKEADMIATFYALIHLKIPYIPLDKIYPKERINKIIESSGSQLMIHIGESNTDFNQINQLQLKSFELHLVQNIKNKAKEEKDPLIYIIYTSGSTGEPKGVQISTSAVQDFTRWMTSGFGFNATDVFINTAILSFDLSIFEVMNFSALGATILLNDQETTSNAPDFLKRVKEYKGTIWVSTPSFALIYSRIEESDYKEHIKYFLFCGEVLPNKLAENLINNYPKSTIYNTYGPTEATVATTSMIITKDVIDQYNPLPVGKSKPHSELIIENDEIIIVGDNVSLGYVNNETLNKEKFVTVNGKRAFKTGDQGYLENELLFFKGRNDDLIKMHGFRIELNEITNAIDDLLYVKQGVCIALRRNGAVKKIVALVALKEHAATYDIKADLEKTLPHYMIPADFKVVESIPMNQNGKTDKKLLEKIYLNK